jgi:hypothetical protein
LERSRKIFRIVKNKNFVVLDKGFLLNENLSAKAKGILAYLLSLPDDWKLSIVELTKHFKDGEKSIRSGIKELIDAGYITYENPRDESGRYTGGVYLVFETPSKKFSSPNLQKQNVAKPDSEKRHKEKESLINIDDNKNRVTPNIDKIKIVSNREISEAEKEYWKEVFKHRLSNNDF